MARWATAWSHFWHFLSSGRWEGHLYPLQEHCHRVTFSDAPFRKQMFKQKRKVTYMCVRVGFLDGVFIACKCYSSSKPMFCVNTFSDTFIVINMPCTVQLRLCWSSHLSASRCLCLHSEVVVLLLATQSCWRPQRKSPANVLPSPTSTCCPDDKNIPIAAFLQPCHSWVQWNWGGKKKNGGEEKP